MGRSYGKIQEVHPQNWELIMHDRKTHLKMAKCLEQAKTFLSDKSGQYDKVDFVCSAVSSTHSSVKTKELVLSWISKQLDGRCFVTTWAKINGAQLYSFQEFQAYRHAWVDNMIKILRS